ncbi:MAG TPA: hypothetical protein VGB61_13575, partial [Pyrinomonadaceae bacterium]
MNHVTPKGRGRQIAGLIFALLLLQAISGANAVAVAQQLAVPASDASAQSPAHMSGLRLERVQVAGGAELLTVFGTLDGLARDREAKDADVPLVSILRDTLGDA